MAWLEGRTAAEGQDAARMAEACGDESALDGHNPEAAPAAGPAFVCRLGVHRHAASPRRFQRVIIGLAP